ncbi:hypothetical protein ACFOLF_23960 [Paenibacillus sepulcri]
MAGDPAGLMKSADTDTGDVPVAIEVWTGEADLSGVTAAGWPVAARLC